MDFKLCFIPAVHEITDGINELYYLLPYYHKRILILIPDQPVLHKQCT